jgi:hypothetical protein
MTLTYRPAAIPLLLSLALLALYLAFPTKAYYWDGIVFAQAIEDVASGAVGPSISLTHPNHLIYNFAGYFFYKLVHAFNAHIRALTALQILNSIFSAGSATILFLILRDTLRSIYFAVCLTLLFALSATWWKFSTDANAYIPSVFLLLLSFYLVLPQRRPRPLLVALSFFAAMCFHQLAVIAFPVFALGVYFQSRALENRRGPRNVIVFTAVSLVLIVGVYAVAFYFATGSLNISRLLHWAASYSPDTDTRFDLWSNLGYSLRGEVRLFFGGRLNLLRGLMNPVAVLLIALFAIAVLWLLYAVLANLVTLKRRLRDVRPSSQQKHVRLIPQQKTVLLLALMWAVVYLVFLFFWLPQNTFYRVFYLPALIVLLGLALAALPQTPPNRTFATAVFVVAVGLANFLFMIYPFSHVEKYPPLAFALQMNREWPQGTVIYYGAQNSDEALVRYFTRGTEWKLLNAQLRGDTGARPAPGTRPETSIRPAPGTGPESTTRPVPGTGRETSTRPVPGTGASTWLETSAIDQLSSTPEGARWLESHARPESLRELNNGAYRIRFVQLR